jgi:hypothetical protein
VANNKKLYIDLLSSVDRPGIDNLLSYLENSDFYTAPCSRSHHLACEEGLLVHHLNVYDSAVTLYKSYGHFINCTEDSLKIVSLTHDINKIHYYKKVEKGGMTVYEIDDQLPYGHGEKSVLILSGFIDLTVPELIAIRWHMGGFTPGASEKKMGETLDKAFREYPLSFLLHMADMVATHLLEG